MNYNYYFEIAAMIITTVLFIDLVSKRQFYRKDSKLFAIAILFQFLTSAVDLASCKGLEIAASDPSAIPRALNSILLLLYYCFKPVIMFFSNAAILAYPENSLKHVRKYIVASVVICGVNLITALLSTWIPLFYYFDEAQRFSNGPVHELVYLYQIFAALIVLVFCFNNHKKFLQRERLYLIAAGTLIIASVTIQKIYPSLIITGIGTAIAMLIIFISLENPNSFLDRRTESNNAEALRVLINDWNEKNDRYTFATIKIHRFKTFSNTYGYQITNEATRMLAEFLRHELNCARNVFRLNEESYVLVIEGDAENLLPYLNKINDKFAEMWTFIDGTLIQLDRAITICQYPSHFTDFSSFVEMNNYLMKQIAPIPAGGVLYADDSILKKKMRTIQVEDALRRAIAEDNIKVYYQPIYDIKEKKVIGLEALSRLHDKYLGNIPPDEFIKVAEDTGRIFELGTLVLKKVCRFIRRQLLKMPNNTVKTVEVNLSPIQLIHRDTLSMFKKIILDNKIPKGLLNFEITESATSDTPSIVTNAMQELTEIGCDFSLDDYGTGYSNISYMLKFSFVRIKFDKELIWSYFGDKSANIILRHEFEIIKALGKEIIAEGVEEKRYIKELAKHGVRYFQGFYFAKALPPDEIIAYLENPTPKEMF